MEKFGNINELILALLWITSNSNYTSPQKILMLNLYSKLNSQKIACGRDCEISQPTHL